jgi:SagB-type dehydrogenase family enzyme
VAAVLNRTAGFSSSAEQGAAGHRWTESAGNLGSVRLYLTARQPLFGRPAGTLFAYEDTGHRLVEVHADQAAAHYARRAVRFARGEPDILVLLVGDVQRLARKYGDFAFRLAHLDAGCAAAQLSAVATGLGLDFEIAGSWDAKLADAIDLSEGREILAAVAGLYETETSHATRP